ncbi:MAG: LptF/LptG family permease [Planctomycetes bacterium]|nr:LptF/LptG family permease [Planctomycetota bacterium]
MTLLDRYVGRIATGAFLAALLFFLFVSVLSHLLRFLPQLTDRAAEKDIGGLEMAWFLLVYYAKLSPVLFTMVAPFATAIAGMFAVSRLQHANETVPMLFVGRSIHRVLRPVLLVGAVAAGGMAACWQWVIPHVGADITNADRFIQKGDTKFEVLVDERTGEASEYVYVRRFYPDQGRLEDVHFLTQGALAADTVLVTAPVAIWDAAARDWRLEQGWSKRAGRDEPQQWLGRGELTPEVLLRKGRDTIDAEFLSYSDLVEMVDARPNQPDIRLALHRHITWPLANVLLLLLVLPLAVHFERGSRIERVLGAIGLCGGYMLVDMTCQSLGGQGQLHPVVAAWTPTIVFGALGIVMFGSTRT